MREQKKTYVGAAVFFEQLADDGWPEDGGLWPFDGFSPAPIKYPDERVHGARRLSLSQLVKPFIAERQSKIVASLGNRGGIERNRAVDTVKSTNQY